MRKPKIYLLMALIYFITLFALQYFLERYSSETQLTESEIRRLFISSIVSSFIFLGIQYLIEKRTIKKQ